MCVAIEPPHERAGDSGTGEHGGSQAPLSIIAALAAQTAHRIFIRKPARDRAPTPQTTPSTCTQTAIVAKNKVMEASASASSNTARNMIGSPIKSYG
jgi:hypothetical protein